MRLTGYLPPEYATAASVVTFRRELEKQIDVEVNKEVDKSIANALKGF
jgi:hypothetical protein